MRPADSIHRARDANSAEADLTSSVRKSVIDDAAAAFVVAGQNFDDAKVIVMITVVLIVEFLMLLPFARILARGR